MKNFLKTTFMVLLFAVISTAFVFAGGQQEEGAAEEITIRLGHNQSVDTPQDVGMKRFKELVEEKTDGNVTVEIYPSMELGSMREQAESTQQGVIHITEQPAAVLSTFAETMSIWELPFLWREPSTGYQILDGEIGREVLGDLEDHGFKGLGYTTAGMRHITANDPINVPSDLKGKRIRVMPAPILQDMIEIWGGVPTTTEFGEVYGALEQGVVDGQENPLQTIEMMSFYEVQDYINLTNHIHFLYGVVANLEWFNGLSSDLQNIIQESMNEANKYQRQVLHDREDEYREIIENAGTEFNNVSSGDLDKWEQVSMELHEKYADVVGRDRLESIYDKVDEIEGE